MCKFDNACSMSYWFWVSLIFLNQNLAYKQFLYKQFLKFVYL